MLMGMVLLQAALAQSEQEWGAWRFSPYARPQASLSSWSDGRGSSTALQFGAQAGVNFRKDTTVRPSIRGQARAQGSTLLNAASGLDVRAGVFAGPSWGKTRVQTGPDLYWNRFAWQTQTLPPTLGLAWPVQVLTRLDGFSLSAGVQPAFFLSSERASVDWSEQSFPGFGDEMTVFGAVSTSLSSLRIQVSVSQTVTAYGAQRGLGFGVRI